MKISYNWLQSYFNGKLPPPEKVADALTMGSFQVESVEKIKLAGGKEDVILDIDILSHRAADALCHGGVAKEVALHLDVPYALDTFSKVKVSQEIGSPEVTVLDSVLCPRYMGRSVTNIRVATSPTWLQERLEAIGQRSINNVVDAANYVMFVLNQPLHAFDADLLAKGESGPIIEVRPAKSGEKMKTLDNKDLELTEDDLILSDGEKVLGLAGIKGAAGVGVEEGTVNLVLESANFSPRALRKSYRRVGIRTDASMRFEHGISPILAERAMEMFTALILELAGTKETKVGPVADIFPMQANPFKLGTTLSEINESLGTVLSSSEVEEILNRYKKYCGFQWKKVEPIEIALVTGKGLVGVPYKNPVRLSYDAPDYFDCSSLMAYLCAEVGVQIPRVSVDQFVFGTPVTADELCPGDLIFSNTGTVRQKPDYDGAVHETFRETVKSLYSETVDYMKGAKVPEGVDHCGMYLGNGEVLHAASEHGKVVIEKFTGSKQFANIVGYRRVLSDGERYVVTAPHERVDLRSSRGFLTGGTSADLVEEIGRVYGYDKIKSVMPPLGAPAQVNKLCYYAELLSAKLLERGCSEVMTYTFDAGPIQDSLKGDPQTAVEMRNPIAADKAYLRTNLSDGLATALARNVVNKDLLGVSQVRMFEVGHVFTTAREWLSVALAVEKVGKKHDASAEARHVLEEVLRALGVRDPVVQTSVEGVAETDLSLAIEDLPEPKTYADLPRRMARGVAYKEFSPYPFSTRDISVWVPDERAGAEVLSIAKVRAGVLLVATRLFDRFEKINEDAVRQISFAYRLVFQASDRTLEGEEVSAIMDDISADIAAKGWTVR